MAFPPAGDVQILSFVRLKKGAAILTDGHPRKIFTRN